MNVRLVGSSGRSIQREDVEEVKSVEVCRALPKTQTTPAEVSLSSSVFGLSCCTYLKPVS